MAFPAPASGPLAGLIVADLSTVLAGPFCAMLLADLGAEVVKVESPELDFSRTWGPPYVGAPEPGIDYSPDDPRSRPGYLGEAAYYLAANRGKRSIRLDLKMPGGRDVLRRLLARSDVLVENFRVRTFARLGFDDATLEALNPGLVHCAISGYGPDGPLADRPGFDFIIQAVSGLMSITGVPDTAGGEPVKVGVAVTDLMTGALAAVGALSALVGRERSASPAAGLGQRIDLSLFESALAMLANQATNHLVAGRRPGRMGTAHPNITPYEAFPTSDGQVAVAVGTESQWPRFCEALARPDLRDDPRFRTNPERVAHRTELRGLLESVFPERPTAEWIDRLDRAEVPCGPINDVAAAFAEPQAAVRRMIETVEHPTAGPLRLPGIPFKLSRTPASIRRPPPLPAEHSDEILAWLGYGPDEIEALRSARVV
ncbi:MAG TPA: CoA transferase [Candidatus Limnocylindrales bacterium]|nr:CoA transferase [Candidatus Limnocylindrales bacterium]